MTNPTAETAMPDNETREARIERIKQELFEATATTDITLEKRDEYLQKKALLDSLIRDEPVTE